MGTSDRSKPRRTKRSQSDEASRPSADALPRPPSASRNWDDLPGIKKRPSLAPPAPPPSHAPPAPTTHELFDVETAAADKAREEAARRASLRATRPHPPKREVSSAHVIRDSAQRIGTPLSWEASKEPALADAVEEEISDEFLEPVADSVPLTLEPIVSSEPLASALPPGSLAAPPPSPARRKSSWSVAGLVVVGVAGLAVVALFASTTKETDASATRGDEKPPAIARTEALPPSNPALRVPLPPLELDIGVPTSEPVASAEAEKPDPTSVPPVAPSGVLPALPPKVEGPPFDSEAATAALSSAAAAAGGCRKEGDPAGSATVIVRFAPSGRVTSAVVESGPFAGTVTGGCIATTFRKARVPAFSGDFVSVKKTVSLQ